MKRVVVLDSGPLSFLASTKGSQTNEDCTARGASLFVFIGSWWRLSAVRPAIATGSRAEYETTGVR